MREAYDVGNTAASCYARLFLLPPPLRCALQLPGPEDNSLRIRLPMFLAIRQQRPGRKRR